METRYIFLAIPVKARLLPNVHGSRDRSNLLRAEYDRVERSSSSLLVRHTAPWKYYLR